MIWSRGRKVRSFCCPWLKAMKKELNLCCNLCWHEYADKFKCGAGQTHSEQNIYFITSWRTARVRFPESGIFISESFKPNKALWRAVSPNFISVRPRVILILKMEIVNKVSHHEHTEILNWIMLLWVGSSMYVFSCHNPNEAVTSLIVRSPFSNHEVLPHRSSCCVHPGSR